MLHSDLEKIHSIIAPVIGQPAWDVFSNWGSFIGLDFGSLARSYHGQIAGQWHIFINKTGWRIEDSNTVYCGSGDPGKK